MTARRILRTIAGVLFVLSLPVLFGSLSLRWLVSDVGWYRAGFERDGVSERTGISAGELSASASQISRYLLLERERVDDLLVTVRGRVGPLFNERETTHMGHVRGLMGSFYTLQLAAGAYALIYLLAVCRQRWRDRASRLGNQFRRAGILTVALFATFGLLSVMDFDQLFQQFHLASFDGDCWLFDPTKDNLVMMFPQGFWYDSALRLALATAVQAIGAFLAGTFLAMKGSAAGDRSLAPGSTPVVGT
ncbi:MAG: TIGR01906 family membrane protein [Chloroflexota bacterium]